MIVYFNIKETPGHGSGWAETPRTDRGTDLIQETPTPGASKRRSRWDETPIAGGGQTPGSMTPSGFTPGGSTPSSMTPGGTTPSGEAQFIYMDFNFVIVLLLSLHIYILLITCQA